MNPINSEIIDETTKKFADDPEVAKRLLWWLRNGHSCERWFQFEWAYKLESILESRYQNAYSVGCERDLHRRCHLSRAFHTTAFHKASP